MLAYLAVHDDAGFFDLQSWLPKVREAVRTLDLVVFVPIETPDRIAFSASDDAGGLRVAVDERLRELLDRDPYEFGLDVVEVAGDLESRIRTVLKRLRTARGASDL